ncbi:MAG: DUF6758 family protein [Geodermatophilaceae bacterium]
MTAPPCCPRCGLDVHRAGPGSGWRCRTHGAVEPVTLHAPVPPGVIESSRLRGGAPLWTLWPSPPEWAVTGLALAGDVDQPARATALAATGPAPLGGMAELVLVAEEPGTGLGAGYAALAGPDPGSLPTGAPHATVRVDGHSTAMWALPTRADRCVHVGEAMGMWLWAVFWPAAAGLLLLEDLVLLDLREHLPGGLGFGPASPYVRPGG